jgi:phenylalanine-4-hydroxylase
VGRRGLAEGGPYPGPAVVAIGPGELPEAGPFRLELPGGVRLTGRMLEGDEVMNLEGTLDGRPLALPARALLLLGESLPSVAGGPADPEAWDRWFGSSPSALGDAEQLARQRKGNALPAGLATLYQEVRDLRQGGGAGPDRLEALQRALAPYPEDWLLAQELQELRTPAASPTSEASP